MTGELDKIAAHGPITTPEQLERLVAGTEQLELYKVLDLLAGPQPAAGAALLADLIEEGRSTQYLLSILAGQVRDLLMVHALLLRGHRSSRRAGRGDASAHLAGRARAPHRAGHPGTAGDALDA